MKKVKEYNKLFINRIISNGARIDLCDILEDGQYSVDYTRSSVAVGCTEFYSIRLIVTMSLEMIVSPKQIFYK